MMPVGLEPIEQQQWYNTRNCCQSLENWKHRSALFACFPPFAFSRYSVPAAGAMPGAGGRWCLCCQTRQELPKHPHIAMGTGDAPLASLEMPNNSPSTSTSHRGMCPGPAPAPPNRSPPPRGGLLAPRTKSLIFIRMALFMCNPWNSFPWDNKPPPGCAGQKSADNSTRSFIWCGIVTVRTPSGQQWAITVGSDLQMGKNSPSREGEREVMDWTRCCGKANDNNSLCLKRSGAEVLPACSATALHLYFWRVSS